MHVESGDDVKLLNSVLFPSAYLSTDNKQLCCCKEAARCLVSLSS